MTEDELDRLFTSVRHSAFRLETLDRYAVPSDDALFAAFLAGRLPRRTPETSLWLREVADHVAAGRRIYRVHVLSQPLSDYLRYELSTYPDNVAAGEAVLIADRSAYPRTAQLTEDFWLFDDSVVALMRYDEEGRFLGADRAPDDLLDEYRRRRDLALAHAVPLDTYIAAIGQEALRA